jgi:hypothetical protein
VRRSGEGSFACDATTAEAQGLGHVCIWGIRTLNTNVYVVLLTLLDLAGIFIRFRERVESLEVLDGHTRAGEGFVYVRWGCVGRVRV